LLNRKDAPALQQGLFFMGFDRVFVIQKLLFIVVCIKNSEIEVIFIA
jgi:hypothetical protein